MELTWPDGFSEFPINGDVIGAALGFCWISALPGIGKIGALSSSGEINDLSGNDGIGALLAEDTAGRDWMTSVLSLSPFNISTTFSMKAGEVTSLAVSGLWKGAAGRGKSDFETELTSVYFTVGVFMAGGVPDGVWPGFKATRKQE